MVSREDVIYAYRFLLRREPESEDVIQHHMEAAPNFNSLRLSFERSPEYRRRDRYPGGRYEKPASLTQQSNKLPYSLSQPSLMAPDWQLCTASQFREPLFGDWRRTIRRPFAMHRKAWEWTFILQVLQQHSMLQPGRHGIGFAVGREPLVATLAAHGCSILATDAPLDAVDTQWVDTDQHASSLATLNEAGICEPATFAENVSFRPVDMNEIPTDLRGFDFLWSSCAMEHLGSLEHGIHFVCSAMDCLKPGGVAVHTTEFNLNSDELTLETPTASAYRKQDIERLYLRLAAEGHVLPRLNFVTGSEPEDFHVDLPPYSTEIPAGFTSPIHLKLLWHDTMISLVLTSIGLFARKPDQGFQ